MIKKSDLRGKVEAYNADACRRVIGQGAFVGAVLDECSPDLAESVTLIVGINYGQLGTSAGVIGQPAEELGYGKHVRKIIGQKSPQPDRHVVLWNFYPFLTDKEWLRETKNSAGEAVLIFDRGYKDPLGEFARLEAFLAPELIVFHGITSAVPLLARVALSRVGRREAYLVNNLGRGQTGEVRQIG